jgi:hypothetical protein
VPPGPEAPGSPHADPGTPDKPEPQQDSLEDIRNDLDHEPGGLTEPDPQDQQLLANAVPQNPDGTPQRFPDPFGPWSQLQNDGGNEVPGRSNNCADCSRSFLETWRGNPQVSAPRTLDTDENGNLDPWSPESDANENQIRWSGAPHSYAGEGSDPDTAQRIADDLLQAGHGAHAIVQVDWPGGGGHAFNAVNHNGKVVWIDTQSGEVSHDPLHIPHAEHVWHIPMDPDGNPLHPAETDTGDSENQNDESQPENSDNPDNPESNGQPDSSENNAQPDNNPQNDASGNTPKQPDGTDKTTPDNGSTPTRTATDSPATRPDHNAPSDPTPNRDTPQQTTTPSDPRTSIPHQQTADPRTTDPRTTDPRTTDPRTADPRTADPRRDNPTQKEPETSERPDGRRPNTPPRADEARPDQTRPDQTRPDHREESRSQGPDENRPDDPDQTPADTSRDRPSDMNKDSAVPTRESLPDGRNADAANYVKDSVNGKKPLYGDIAAENPTQTSQPTSPERPSGPADPAGSTPDANDQASRRQRDLAMLARANSKDPKDRAWFEKHYWPKSGYRRSRTAPAEDGRPVPQLHPTHDPNTPWMLANDTPDAEPEDYITEGARSGKRKTEISDENLKRLDKTAKARQQAIDADRQPHRDRKAAKDAYEANKTPKNKKKFEEADAKHSPLHGKMGRASENYGEEVAEFHAMPRHFPDHTRIDDRATGNNRFDQIWVDPSTNPPEFVVVEAKGSAKADLGERRGIPSADGADETDAPQNTGQDQNDGTADDDQTAQDDPRNGAAKVRQGTRAYFQTILHEMDNRAMRVLNDPKATAAQKQAAADEARLAQDLRTALEERRITYVLVKGHSDGERHNGYEMHQFDIRTQEEKDADNAQDPEA